MRRFLVVAALVSLAACSGGHPATAGGSPTPSAPGPGSPRPVYAAIGASDTVGSGATDPGRDAWPAVFARSLPAGTVYRNFGIGGETVSGALVDEVPKALELKPTLVTVWLNVNDITAGVSVQDYQAQLTQLVHALRQAGHARVLVANTPWLDRLPVYVSCRTTGQFDGVQCPRPAMGLTPATINAAVDSYNTAITEVAQEEGAELVDLHAQGEVADAHPEYVSSDGFHPSSAGYAFIAGLFVARYQQGTS